MSASAGRRWAELPAPCGRVRGRGISNVPVFFQPRDDARGMRSGIGIHRLDGELRVLRLFIWAVDAGEIADLARLRLHIEPLRVALHALLDRRVDENLDELTFTHQLARQPAF